MVSWQGSHPCADVPCLALCTYSLQHHIWPWLAYHQLFPRRVSVTEKQVWWVLQCFWSQDPVKLWFSEIWGMCMDRCGTCLSASTWRVSPGIKEVTDCGRQKWVWELVVHRVMFGQLQWLPSFLWFRCLSVQIFTWARRCEPDWHPGLPTGYTGLLLLTCQQFSSKT